MAHDLYQGHDIINFLLSLAKYGTIKKYEMIDEKNNKMAIVVG